jgi:hypothetical protein
MVSRDRRREATPYWWVPLVAMLPLIAGCSDTPVQAEAAPAGPVYLEAPKPAVQRPARPAQTTARRQATTVASPRATRPPETTAAARPEAGDPVRLVGQDESRIQALFGRPNEEVEAAPGKIWRYTQSNCRLDVNLYPDVQTRVFRTLAYEVTSHDNSDEGRRTCLLELQQRASTSARR